jgi:L-glutamine synthetase (EC 6.3.1.2)
MPWWRREKWRTK